MMVHDFVKFPELTNGQMNDFYHDSPHRQITEDFFGRVIKIMDGDTIKVKWTERDFLFPVRFVDIAAPELKDDGGKASQSWLEKQLLGNDVEIVVDPKNRVGKWGRLLGRIYHEGLNIGDQSISEGHSVPWKDRNAGEIPDFDVEAKKWEV